jgi:hypothetical protein
MRFKTAVQFPIFERSVSAANVQLGRILQDLLHQQSNQSSADLLR